MTQHTIDHYLATGNVTGLEQHLQTPNTVVTDDHLIAVCDIPPESPAHPQRANMLKCLVRVRDETDEPIREITPEIDAAMTRLLNRTGEGAVIQQMYSFGAQFKPEATLTLDAYQSIRQAAGPMIGHQLKNWGWPIVHRQLTDQAPFNPDLMEAMLADGLCVHMHTPLWMHDEAYGTLKANATNDRPLMKNVVGTFAILRPDVPTAEAFIDTLHEHTLLKNGLLDLTMETTLNQTAHQLMQKAASKTSLDASSYAPSDIVPLMVRGTDTMATNLIAFGADKDAQDVLGNTRLMRVVKNALYEARHTGNLFIPHNRFDINPNLMDNDGFTPLTLLYRHESNMRLVIEGMHDGLFAFHVHHKPGTEKGVEIHVQPDHNTLARPTNSHNMDMDLDILPRLTINEDSADKLSLQDAINAGPEVYQFMFNTTVSNFAAQQESARTARQMLTPQKPAAEVEVGR